MHATFELKPLEPRATIDLMDLLAKAESAIYTGDAQEQYSFFKDNYISPVDFLEQFGLGDLQRLEANMRALAQTPPTVFDVADMLATALDEAGYRVGIRDYSVSAREAGSYMVYSYEQSRQAQGVAYFGDDIREIVLKAFDDIYGTQYYNLCTQSAPAAVHESSPVKKESLENDSLRDNGPSL